MHAWQRYVLATGVVLLAACGRGREERTVVPPAETVVVRTGPVSASADFSGEVRARYESDLAFRIGGKVIERRVETGSRVRKGDALARLDPQDARLAADAARAQVGAAAADHALAKAELERYRQLHSQKFVSRAVLDARETAYRAALARLDQARAQASVSGNQSEYTTLRAERDGVITAVSLEPGQVVAAGQPVMRFARTEEKEVLVNVPEGRLRELRESRTLRVVLWADPGRSYAARVREVAPSADSATRTFAVRVAIADADEAVKLGMTANVLMHGAEGTRAVLLPLTAVFEHEGRASVWIVERTGGQVAARPVQVAAFREDGALVVGGVRDGDVVVARGVHKLRVGQQVKPVAYASATGAPRP